MTTFFPNSRVSRRRFLKNTTLTAGGIAAAGMGLRWQQAQAKALSYQPILDAIPTMTFTHGGALNTAAELQFIKTQIKNKADPWSCNYEKMATSSYASLSYTPHPVAHVSQDYSGANDVGGFDLINDAIAAYTHALAWQFSGDPRHAQKAADILNAWSSTLVDILGGNWVLLAAWSASVSPLAAEIIRDYPAWASADKARYTNMLNTIYLPILNKRYLYGNREFACCDALCAIGVFNEDRAAFYQGVYHWISYFPCYVYLSSDGPKPKVADYWLTEPTLDQYYAMHANIFPNPADSWVYKPNNPKPGVLGDDKTAMVNSYNSGDATPLWNGMSITPGFVPGSCSETMRDLAHCENSIGEVFAVTELARVQGYDLYTDSKDRLAAFLEFQASLRLGHPMPLGYAINANNGIGPTYEIGYNHLVNVLGMSLPYTQQLIQPSLRLAQSSYWTKPAPPGVAATTLLGQTGYAGGWETLTHGNLNGASPHPFNLALGKPTTASSIQDSNHAASMATDGNLSTRWASLRSDPQWISVDLGSSYDIHGITLRWETAYARMYAIQVSYDAVTWTTIYHTATGAGGVEQLTGLSGTGRYVRMYATQRATQYGYSLWEFEVYGCNARGTNLALYQPATASSVYNNNIANNATDGNTATRWASAGGNPGWIYVDLGRRYHVHGVTLLPHAVSYPTTYSIQVSDDTSTWTTIYSTTTGTFFSQDITGISGTGRYVRMYATVGANNGWYSLWDFQVYGSNA